jgi:hypothetical protein
MTDLNPEIEIPNAAAGDSFLWGASAIAPVIGRSTRQTFTLLERGRLPARKIGQQWVASRRKLQAFLAGEAAA